jgi:hypothetical protein
VAFAGSIAGRVAGGDATYSAVIVNVTPASAESFRGDPEMLVSESMEKYRYTVPG